MTLRIGKTGRAVMRLKKKAKNYRGGSEDVFKSLPGTRSFAVSAWARVPDRVVRHFYD